MSSHRPSESLTLALSRTRPERPAPDGAEVIDLVHLPKGTRPTPIAYLDFEEVERLRVMECEDYQGCLTFASEVRWRSFHCRQCPKNPERRPLDQVGEEVAVAGPAAPIIKLR